MDSQNSARGGNNPPSRLPYGGPKFKSKNQVPSASKTSPPPSYVWIIHTNLDPTTLDRPSFSALVSKDSTIITSTVEVARDKVMGVAQYLVKQTGWYQPDINMEGDGVLGDGDLCCTIRSPISQGQDAPVKARVHAWKVEVFR